MGKRRRVAVMIELDRPFKYEVEVYGAGQQYAAQAGWDCTVSPFVTQMLRRRRKTRGPYDGIVGRFGADTAAEARRAGVPVVNVWTGFPGWEVPSVLPDTTAAAAMAAAHLLGRGFRQFAFLGYSRDTSSRLELDGFRSTLSAAGFSSRSLRRLSITTPTTARAWESLVDRMGTWIDDWPTPIGVYGVLDLPCRYLMDVCRSRGLRVPQDVAVIGRGNESVICDSPAPTLTSVELGYTHVGYHAAALLDRLMDGQPPPEAPLWLPPVELVPRQSTDAYAVDDPLVARALRFIAEHGHEPIRVADVVAAVPASRRSLQQHFKTAMRRSIADEITRLRLERAKRRLVESDEPIKTVAADSGFSNLNHFYRALVRVEGLSPRAYRAQRRSGGS